MSEHDHPDRNTVSAQHETVVDPVCGMQVDPAKSPHRHELGGTAYSFCSARCLEKFRANPDQYLNPPKRDPAVAHPAMGSLPEAARGTIWTCPMHPEIRPRRRGAVCSFRRHVAEGGLRSPLTRRRLCWPLPEAREWAALPARPARVGGKPGCARLLHFVAALRHPIALSRWGPRTWVQPPRSVYPV